MTEKSYQEKYNGKTLVLHYVTEHEWRVPIGGNGWVSVSSAIRDIMTSSGISGSIPGVVPESVEMWVEE